MIIKLFEKFKNSNSKILSELDINMKDYLDMFDAIDISKLLNHLENDLKIEINNFDYFIKNAYEILEEINMLPNKLELYRVIFLYKITDFDDTNLGNFWSNFEVDDYIIDKMISESPITDIDNKEPYIITAFYNKNDIDYYNTITNRFLFPDEEEINIKDNTKEISYSIKKYD